MAKKLWGGRFKKKTDPLVESFTSSIGYDQKLARYDVLGSTLHAEILKKAGLLTAGEAAKLTEALKEIGKSIESGAFKADPKCEDIHTNIQNILQNKIGGIALKLHTARSRNEQVAFATRLYLKSESKKVHAEVLSLAKALSKFAETNKHVIVPGFTHLQHAQPVLLSDYIGAYIAMLMRDAGRLEQISKNIKITMGAGALAGAPINASNYEVKIPEVLKDMAGITKMLNVQAVANSVDAVSDRDFVVEALSVLSIIGMHLSRLAEDFIIWSTEEFGFIEIGESFCTGSSLMPQKKNPDALELIRGYTGTLYGNLVSVLTMMKGLPLTYNRDMQLDKQPLFDSLEIVSDELKVLRGIIKTLKIKKDKLEKQLKDESLYATDLVYYLVGKGIAFTDAHAIIGKLIRYSIDNSTEIKKMTQSDLKNFSDKLVKREIIGLFDPKVSVKSKKSIKRGNKYA